MVYTQTNESISFNLAKNSIYLSDAYYKNGDLKKAKKFLLEGEKYYKIKYKTKSSSYIDLLIKELRVREY